MACCSTLIGAVVPFTLLIVQPTNQQLLAPERDLGSADTRRLLERWGRLHAIRSIAGVMAAALMLGTLIAAEQRSADPSLAILSEDHLARPPPPWRRWG